MSDKPHSQRGKHMATVQPPCPLWPFELTAQAQERTQS
jgi:hypothetical protein